jgi:hypothetical protein
MKGDKTMQSRFLGTSILSVFVLAMALPARGGLPPGTYVLPDIKLGDFQNALLPGTIDNDRKILLGGIGSSLYHFRGDADDTFWMITDRGPNGDATVTLPDGSSLDVKTFPIPTFDPTILQVRAQNGTLAILSAIPILTRDGLGVGGLPNAPGYDDPGYDWSATTPVPFNANGLDSEGLARDRFGDFWVCEEYAPSILHINSQGKVLKRYLPVNYPLDASAFGYPVAKVLPEILLKRKVNRGFEGITLSTSPSQRTLYVSLQSPLLNPDKGTGNASRNLRVFAFDTVGEKVTAEYVYRIQPAAEYAATDNPKPKASDMKISELTAMNESQIIVDERTDFVAKLFVVSLAGATNILGTKWDSLTQSPSLESLADPATEGITALPKTALVNLDTVPGMPDKIEGVSTLRQPFAVVVANDNDFGVGTFDPATGDLISTGTKNKMIVFDFDLLSGGGGTPSIPGDIDGDADLDIGDLTLLVKAIGTTFGDAGFIMAADLNDDFKITIADYVAWIHLLIQDRSST